MTRQRYPTDLTDAQWAIIEPLLPAAKPGGRPRSADLREVVNAILYLLRTGCAWRMLPHDFPPWGTVWAYFRRWRDDGTLERLHDALRDAGPPGRRARAPPERRVPGQPDRQDGGKRGLCGYDAGKKTKGRKRHLFVDTLGLIHGLVVHAADVQDPAGGKLVADPADRDAGAVGADLGGRPRRGRGLRSGCGRRRRGRWRS